MKLCKHILTAVILLTTLTGLAAEKRIITHVMSCLPQDRCMPDKPLDTWQSRYEKAAELGINEFTYFMSNGHIGALDGFIESTPKAAKIPGFELSICIGLPRCKAERDWIPVIKKWCDAAKDNPGIAKVNGRPVIWTYHAAAFDLEGWKRLTKKLHDDGYNPFIVGDMFAYAFNHRKEFNTEIYEWAKVLDSLYFFGPNFKDERLDILIDAIKKANKGNDPVTIGTIGGGYWRWGNNHQGMSQLYNGTDKYTKCWDFIEERKDDLTWLHVTTWNDFLEHTMNEPSRNNAGVYGELLKNKSARFKNEDFTPETKFWLTAPAELKNGPKGLNEYIYEIMATGLTGKGKAKIKLKVLNEAGKNIRTEKVTLKKGDNAFRFAWVPKENEFKDSHFLTLIADVKYGRKKFTGTLYVPIWPLEEKHLMYKTPRTIQLLSPEEIPPVATLDVDEKQMFTVSLLEEAEKNPDYRIDVLYDMHSKGKEGVNLGSSIQGIQQLPQYEPFDPFYFKRGFRQAATVTRDGRVSWAKPIWIEKPLPVVRTNAPKVDVSAAINNKFNKVKINFQPPGVKPPEGYIADVGKPFNNRKNGYFYGWSRDVKAFSRQRKLNENLLLDTSNCFKYYFSSWYWTIAVPNGKYNLKLSLGDAAFKTTSYLMINGIQTTDPTPKKIGSDLHELNIDVTNNEIKLHVDAEIGGAGINFLEITPLN